MANTYDFLISTNKLAEPFRDVNMLIGGKELYLPLHSHSWYHVNHVCSGAVIVGYRGVKYEVTEGCTFVLPPVEPHTIESTIGYVQIGMNIDPVSDPRGLAEELRNCTDGGFVMVRHLVSVQPDTMRALLSTPTRRNLLRAQNIAETILLDAMDAMRKGEGDEFILRFTKMLELHRPWELRLSDMCRILSLSRTQLERLSFRAFGCGAAEYCARIRYQRVCELLTEDHPLDAIAQETGFTDTSHLSKFFSARAGMPPGRYRSRWK